MDLGTTKKDLGGMQQRIVALLAVVGGIILLCGVGLSGKELWFNLRAVKTMGKCTDSSGMIDPATNLPNVVYLVRFTTSAGKTVEFYEMLLGEPLPDKEPMAVYYDPINPSDARLLTRSRWTFPLQILAVGIFITGCSVGVKKISKRPMAPIEPGKPVMPVA